jgi:hypothetical protein
MRLRWPNQITPYRSALPGLAGPGMDISKPELPTKFYFINDMTDAATGAIDPSKGPNCYTGTGRYCWYANQGAGFHKVIIPLIGGYGYVGRTWNGDEMANMDYIGHAAPGPGLIFRCGRIRIQGDNQRLWHCASWMGDEVAVGGGPSFDADQRDCFSTGQPVPGTIQKNIAFINCEGRFGMDEIAECGYSPLDGGSWLRGAIYDPLHVPPDWSSGDPNHGPGEDHGYGQLVGGAGSGPTDRTLTAQSVYSCTTDRNPLWCGVNHAHINNIHYNHGRPNPGGRGEGCHIADNLGSNAGRGLTMHINVVGNLSVLGPEQAPIAAQEPVLAAAASSMPVGCTGHSNLNSQLGWTLVNSQDQFIRTVPYPEFRKKDVRLSAWYDGFGDDYRGVTRFARDPLRPTIQEALEFSRLLRETVGMMPRRRYLYKGGLHRCFDQIDNAIRGVPATFQYINRVSDLPANGADATGWEVMPAVPMMDPLNPTKDWHAPMPLDATRDDVLTSGYFSNGAPKTGYTKWRAWVIEQYFYVMGP